MMHTAINKLSDVEKAIVMLYLEEKGSLKGKLTSVDIPFLITSTQEEAEDITNILLHEVELSESQIQHIPSFEGFHGVRAL